MRSSVRRRTMIAIAIAAVIAGVVIAIVSTRDNGASSTPVARARADRPRPTANLTVAADYLGLTRPQLRRELRSHGTVATIADSTSGKSSAGLVAALVSAKAARLAATAATNDVSTDGQRAKLEELKRQVTAWVHRPHTVSSASLDLAVTANYLGMTVLQVRHAQLSGRSLAALTHARGKSTAGLIAAIVRERKAKLDAEVSSGVLTTARRNLLLAQLPRRVTLEVKRTPTRRPTS